MVKVDIDTFLNTKQKMKETLLPFFPEKSRKNDTKTKRKLDEYDLGEFIEETKLKVTEEDIL